MRLRIFEFQFDDWNREELHRHRVTEDEVRQVLDNDPVFLPNVKAGMAPVVMIGYTFGGRLLTIPLDRTPVEHVWRPATGWDASPDQRARHAAARQRS